MGRLGDGLQKLSSSQHRGPESDGQRMHTFRPRATGPGSLWLLNDIELIGKMAAIFRDPRHGVLLLIWDC